MRISKTVVKSLEVPVGLDAPVHGKVISTASLRDCGMAPVREDTNRHRMRPGKDLQRLRRRSLKQRLLFLGQILNIAIFRTCPGISARYRPFHLRLSRVAMVELSATRLSKLQ